MKPLQQFCPSEQLQVAKRRLILFPLQTSRALWPCTLSYSHPALASMFFNATFPFNLLPSISCGIIRHLLCLRVCVQVQFWDQVGRDAQRQLCYRQGCYSKIGLESEVLSVSVKRGAAKWLQPSISAPSESSEMLLHDS